MKPLTNQFPSPCGGLLLKSMQFQPQRIIGLMRFRPLAGGCCLNYSSKNLIISIIYKVSVPLRGAVA
ncbi:hypothetical protein HMPREF9081_0269 [Centipeda periodontii DSM 2778]|uniref:Uncharacterized protein n=1 Tax=Centipeda periodontii DSM 2778 TaxID=888060 RepID=F5RJ34_9FIRM|nr:hypothetical protein HMPREF9081_0269 [Centipeda periodontii DSM 2778]